MAASNSLTVDGEVRYIMQWFNEWSELQREDFLPIFVDYLKSNGAHVNGLVSGMANASCADKPMSLFQCRAKLFREWAPKWPEATKDRLKEKLRELDGGFLDKVEEELKVVENGNGHAAVNGSAVNGSADDEEEAEPPVISEPQPAISNILPDEIALNA